MKIKPTKQPSHKEHKKSTRHRQKRRPPCILPPHGPPQIPRTALELERLLIQSIRLIHQQFNLLSPLENLFDVFDHDSLHVLDLIFYGGESIDVAPRAVVVVHAFSYDL